MTGNEGKKWFLLAGGQVRGPFSTDEAESLAGQSTEPLLWGRGLPEWMPPNEWRRAMASIGSAVTEMVASDRPIWRYRAGGVEHGPVSFGELIGALKRMIEHADVDISEDSGGWREIYEFQKIIDELGITRRSHPRVPIMGTLKIDSPKGQFAAKAVTISEGGIGVNGAPQFPIGEQFKAVLSSQNLFMEIQCTCEVVYVGNDGYTGLRFTNIPNEAHAAVIEYVRKFQNMGER